MPDGLLGPASGSAWGVRSRADAYWGKHMHYRDPIRRVLSILPACLAAAVGAAGTMRPPQSFKATVIPTAMTVRSEWKYVTADPGTGWHAKSFDDASWQTGLSGFGTRNTPGGAAGTIWTDSAIWLRRTVTMPDPAALKGIGLLIHHDETAEVYVNGEMIWSDTGYTVDYVSIPLDTKAQAAFKAGENLVAVHCAQTKGGQYIDVGFETMVEGAATTLIKDAQIEAQEWRYTTEDPVTSNWLSAGYNDSQWSTGLAGFGAAGTPDLTWSTEWKTSDIWLRKAFTLDSTVYDRFVATIQHDEDVIVAINGQLVLQRVGYITRYQDIDITEPAKAALKPGRNVIAVWCHQTKGGQYIDVGLKAIVEDKPVKLFERTGRGAAWSARRVSDASGRMPLWSLPGALRRYQADGRGVPAR